MVILFIVRLENNLRLRVFWGCFFCFRLGNEKELLWCTTFSFCFPFIRCILTNSGLSVDVKERTMEVLAQHCTLRMCEEDIDERYSEVRF